MALLQNHNAPDGRVEGIYHSKRASREDLDDPDAPLL